MRLLIQARDQSGGALDALSRKIKGIAAAAAAYLGLRSVASWITDSIGQAAALERQLNVLRQVSGATAAEMAQLKGAAQAGAQLAGSAAEAAAAQVELAKAGQTATEVLSTLPGVLQLAKTEQMSAADSASLLTAVLSGFGLPAAQASSAVNTLAAGANASRTSAKGLGEALSYVAPMARAAGLSLEQTVAAVAQMAQGGVDGSRAGTALGSVLSQLADPASTASQALRDMGVVSTDLQSVIAALAAGTPMAERAILAFGTEAGPGLRGLIAAGTAGLETMRQTIVSNTSAAAEAAAAYQGGLLGALESLAASWGSLKQRLGDGLLQPLAREVRAVQGQIETWLGSGAAERIGQQIADGFGAAAAAVRGWVRDMDLSAVLASIRETAQVAGDTLAAWGERIDALRAGTGRALDGMRAGWLLFRGTIQEAASVVSAALAGMFTILEGAVRAANAVGLASDAVLERVSGLAASLSDNIRRQHEAAKQSFADAAAAAAGAAGVHEQAAVRVQTASGQAARALEQQGQAAGITADALDALGASGSYAAQGQAAIEAASAKAGDAAAKAAEQAQAQAAAQQQIQDQFRASGGAILEYDARTGRLVQSTGASTAATRTDAAAKAEHERRVKEEAAALALLIERQQAEVEVLARATANLDAASQARIAHTQNLLDEARAEGDLAEAKRLEGVLSDQTVAAARAATEAAKAEAEAAQALAASLREQAEANGDTSAATEKSIALAEQDAAAKRVAADAAAELARHEKAMAAAKERATAATQDQTAAQQAQTGAAQVASRSAGAGAGAGAGGGAGQAGPAETYVDEFGDRRYASGLAKDARVTERVTSYPAQEQEGRTTGRYAGVGLAGRRSAEPAAASTSQPIIIQISAESQSELRLAARARGGRVSIA